MTPDSEEEGEAADTPGGYPMESRAPESPSDLLWGFTESEK